MAEVWPVGAVFAVGGLIVVALYWQIALGRSALSTRQLWGYLGAVPKWAWAVVTLLTTGSVLAVYGWILFGTGGPTREVEMVLVSVATGLFIGGAIAWPIGVLKGHMRLARAAVLCTAVGAVAVWVYAVFVRSSAPVAIQVAASMMAFHHVVVDGLWAILPPPPGPLDPSQFL